MKPSDSPPIPPVFSHIDSQNRPAMVNVGAKSVTHRTAHAVAIVTLPPELQALARNGEIVGKKGPIFHTAIIAGVMAAKKTSELIPLCHALPLDDCRIEITLVAEKAEIEVHCHAETRAKTGVEMEALTGASIAALTIYDMAKAVTHGIRIKDVRLVEKTGGKTDYRAP